MLQVLKSNWIAVLLLAVVASVTLVEIVDHKGDAVPVAGSPADSTWTAPSIYVNPITDDQDRQTILYGLELIEHTGAYFGPRGSVLSISNGMNCQNCHLDAGTRPWGNNYGAVAATYPKFRERSGSVEDIYQRVNDCFERSLNGKAIDTASREMQAIVAYIKWLGNEVPTGKKPYGSGLEKLEYLDRAASPEKGRVVYLAKCQSCHGGEGQGQANPDGATYATPPLWGTHSYNDGAGLYRLSNFASFVKNNMPFNQASHQSPALSNEEAWDVAAYVNSQPRPHKDQQGDWPDLSRKAVDVPVGPYADPFTALQHKYGPFGPIEAWKKQHLNASLK